METPLLLLLPPFAQFNTPYPSLPFLKGFLNRLELPTHQADLSLEVMLSLYSAQGLTRLFEEIERKKPRLSAEASQLVAQAGQYLLTIDSVIAFLQGKNPTLASRICDGAFLPEGNRFKKLPDLAFAFGSTGRTDEAKFLATLYLEEIYDLIVETLDPHFGFGRYAEQLGLSAAQFDSLASALTGTESLVDKLLQERLAWQIAAVQPTLVGLTVPFPGNLYGALKCGQWLKRHHPAIKVVMGGGFVNTELRCLAEPRVFAYVDFVTLDDGAAPLFALIEHLQGKRKRSELKRTFALEKGRVTYFNNASESDVTQAELGVPDYTGLPLADYLSLIEITNPMHRLWNDGRWNKLMLAHGCYWAKCSFCDTQLDYIARYEPNRPAVLCDRLEAVIRQTGQSGFHFVDEAAPPALLKELALEIIKRQLVVSWWSNIRFEKQFTRELCRLLKQSGCIAVSGGLEVSSERVLKLINKGITIPQATRVFYNLTEAGIMVHAYLMYGFPSQTAQETIDSLEVVRQLFLHGLLQSAFWHYFALTAHSPISAAPEKFGIRLDQNTPGPFAHNDLRFADERGCDHDTFSAGLRLSLHNYMQGLGLELPLRKWFDFKIPRSTVAPDYIEKILSHTKLPSKFYF